MWQPLFLTLQLIGTSIAIAGVLGILAAWAGSTAQSGGKVSRSVSYFLAGAIVVSVAMPMILHAAAWEATAGKFSLLAMTQSGARSFGMFGGLLACGWIHGLFGAGLVAMSTWFAVNRTPESVIQQARLDSSPVKTWWCVRLPLALPWVITSLLATAVLAATEMTVADLYGFRTVADEFYLYYASDPTLMSVFVLCFVPLAMAGVVLVPLLVWRARLLAVESWDNTNASEETPSITTLVLACSVAVTLGILIVAVPLGGLLNKAGHEVIVAGDQVTANWSLKRLAQTISEAPASFAKEYQWTAILAFAAATLAILIAWPIASIARTAPRMERLLDVGTVLMVLIPGPMIGLLTVRLFAMPIPGFRALAETTLLPTILALQFRALPVTYWILRAAYRGIQQEVIDSAAIESRWAARMWFIDRPLVLPSLVAAWFAAAIVASGDVPVMLPVLPPGVSTVGTRLFGLLHGGARYQEAALAFWYVLAILIIILLVYGLNQVSRSLINRESSLN